MLISQETNEMRLLLMDKFTTKSRDTLSKLWEQENTKLNTQLGFQKQEWKAL